MKKWYVCYDGKPMAGPYSTPEKADKVLANILAKRRDPEGITIEELEADYVSKLLEKE